MSTGYFHEAALYATDDEFLAVVVPFLEGGREAGEPTLVTIGARNAELVRSAMGDTDGIQFLPGADQYSSPASTIRRYRKLFGELAASGADQIRVVGDVPHPGLGMPWDGWARYEAVVNDAFAEFPLWGLCPYDTRITPPSVLDEVARTHPHLATVDGRHVHNDRFEDPRDFLASRPAAPLDPLQRGEPVVVLHDPLPGEAREAIGALPVELGGSALDDLVTAVSEVVTNAARHGVPPIELRAWVGDERVVVTVRDAGTGTADPFAGLIPARRGPGEGGLGLWLAHQLCSDVSMARTEQGFVVRLVAGAPHVA